MTVVNLLIKNLMIRWKLRSSVVLMIIAAISMLILIFYLHRPIQDKTVPSLQVYESVVHDETIIIYNRIPKSASTTFMGIVYELSSPNKYNVMHLNISKNAHVMALGDQYSLVHNLTNWRDRHPLVVHGHFAFINFQRLGATRPIYINIIRKPLDRLVSYYYFLRNGDNFRPNLIRKKHGDKRTFDECVEANGQDCRVENLWLQVPFFCGQDADCWRPGNRWALEQAKRNALEHYFLVGVTEHFQQFIQLLDASLPRIFRGSTQLYDKETKSHLRQTYNKIPPSAKTISKMQQSRIWQMENEFYQFILDQFNFVRSKSNSADGDKQHFFYEKIRPK